MSGFMSAASGMMSGGGGGMSTGNMMGLMGGGGGGGGDGSMKALRTKGLESYKDMSMNREGSDLQGLMNMVMSQQQQPQQQQMPYSNPYVQSLMGGY